MAGSWVADLTVNGTYTVDGGGHPYELTLGDTVPLGDRVIIAGINIAGVSDTQGNTYAADGAVDDLTIWSAPVTTALAPGDVITVTASAADYGFSAAQFTGITHVSGAASVDCSRTDWADPPTPYDTGGVTATRDESVMLSTFVYHTNVSTVTQPARATFWGDYAVAMSAAGGVVSSGAAQATALWRATTGCSSINDTGSVSGGPGSAYVLLVLYGASTSVCPGGGGDDAYGVVSAAYGPTGQRLRAYNDAAGALFVDRHDDSSPPGVAATVTVETSGVTGLRLRISRDGTAHLTYAHSGAAKQRRSTSQGRTWSVADTIASGYQDVDALEDEIRGLRVVALWDEAAETWYASVGTLDAGGTTWSYTTPALLVANARRGGCLTRRGDAAYEFDYRTTGDVLTTLRNRGLSAAGAGSWS